MQRLLVPRALQKQINTYSAIYFHYDYCYDYYDNYYDYYHYYDYYDHSYYYHYY